MKKVLLFSFGVFLLWAPVQAQIGLPFTQTGFDRCYLEARNSFYSIEKASATCRGVISLSCWEDARRWHMRIESAAQLCQGFVSNACYEDARRNLASIQQAVAICQMVPQGS